MGPQLGRDPGPGPGPNHLFGCSGLECAREDLADQCSERTMTSLFILILSITHSYFLYRLKFDHNKTGSVVDPLHVHLMSLYQ